MTTVGGRRLWTIAVMAGFLMAGPAFARDAAFIQPAGNAINPDAGAVKVEPKDDIDIGETTLNVPRRTTLFFVNEIATPVQIEKITVNPDGNVQAEITNDDCSKQGTIAPASRCSIEVSVTPSSSGPWSVEVLMTHNSAGRIARAKLSGKTTGATTAEKKDTGLTLNAKEATPVNFGDVDIGDKVIRSALMVNDSPDAITLYSIDVIEAGNGLERLDQGCAVDMELKPGESCPVTLVWAPVQNGQISTDLIIRHSGRLGFAVIPLRGAAKGGASTVAVDTKGTDKSSKTPPPPTADELEKAAAGKIAAIGANELPKAPPDMVLCLIGTVGNRAVLLLPDGSTKVIAAGEETTVDDRPLKVMAVRPKSVELLIDGKKKELILGASPELMAKATAEREKSEKTSGAAKASSATAAASTTSATPAAASATTTGAAK